MIKLQAWLGKFYDLKWWANRVLMSQKFTGYSTGKKSIERWRKVWDLLTWHRSSWQGQTDRKNPISNVNTHLTHIHANCMQSLGVFASCHVYIKACNQRTNHVLFHSTFWAQITKTSLPTQTPLTCISKQVWEVVSNQKYQKHGISALGRSTHKVKHDRKSSKEEVLNTDREDTRLLWDIWGEEGVFRDRSQQRQLIFCI